MRVFQEEIFGPVVTVASFTDHDEAISIANDSIYGLGSGVWSVKNVLDNHDPAPLGFFV